MKWHIPTWLVIIAGAGQILVAIIYPHIRHVVFDWYNDIKKLKPLNQEIAKTYGRYIQGLNFGFGLITILLVRDLQNQSRLALALTGLIAAYWTGKVITQFAYYPMYEIPDRIILKIGEVIINSLFLTFSLVFLLLFVYNLSGILGK
jgi:hypothetical protein